MAAPPHAPEVNERLDDILDQETDEKYTALRSACASLQEKLAQEQERTELVVGAAYRGARDATAGMTIPYVPAKKRVNASGGPEEWCIPIVSDLQLGKKTPNYSSDVCAERMVRYSDKIDALIDLGRSNHPIKHAATAWLGDMVEGEDIFPGQKDKIDSSTIKQALKDGPEIMLPWCFRMLDQVETLDVFAVDGNHGRFGRKGQFSQETNADRMLYIMCDEILKREPKYRDRVKFHYCEYAELGDNEANWYVVLKAGEYRALCVHGYQFKGSMGFPWYGLAKKVYPWKAGVIRDTFQDVFMGHFHQLGLIPLNDIKVYANGSTESYNTFAQETLASMSDPAQWLLFAQPEKGRIAAAYDVDLLA